MVNKQGKQSHNFRNRPIIFCASSKVDRSVQGQLNSDKVVQIERKIMSAILNKWRESASLIVAAKTAAGNPRGCNYKIICLKRSSKSGFMPNNYVFPGGNLSKSDSDPKWMELFQKAGYGQNELINLKPTDNVPLIFNNHVSSGLPKYISLRICAIREAFEECGILICKGSGDEDDPGILKWQHKVHDDPNQFINLCSNFKVVPDVWSLKLWANWITPPSMPALFNAVFFITSYDNIPQTQAEETEVQDIKWCDPEEYLLMNREEKVIFPPPQFYELCRLNNFATFEELTKYINVRTLSGCESYFVHKVKTPEGVWSILPGDDLYPERIDEENKEMTKMDRLPDVERHNRMLHKSAYRNELYIKNFKPKADHLPPVPFR